MKTKSTPQGSIEKQLNPMVMALEAGASFIGRGFSGEHGHLQKLIVAAMQHQGYSFVDIFQPCVTFNKVQTYDYYRKRIYDWQQDGHDPHIEAAAHKRAHEWGDRAGIGLLYHKPRQVYHEEIPQLGKPLATTPAQTDISRLLAGLR